MKWRVSGKSVSEDGTTIFYWNDESAAVTIESRKKHIPHANGVGTWDHTEYYVISDNGRWLEETEKHTLKAAKAYAEELIRKAKEDKT